jgi:hypothetical protein
LYIGLMNMISALLANQFGWSLRERLFYISIVSGIIVSTFSTLSNAYNFPNKKDWYKYYLKIMLKHFFTYNGIIYLLEKHLS